MVNRRPKKVDLSSTSRRKKSQQRPRVNSTATPNLTSCPFHPFLMLRENNNNNNCNNSNDNSNGSTTTRSFIKEESPTTNDTEQVSSPLNESTFQHSSPTSSSTSSPLSSTSLDDLLMAVDASTIPLNPTSTLPPFPHFWHQTIPTALFDDSSMDMDRSTHSSNIPTATTATTLSLSSATATSNPMCNPISTSTSNNTSTLPLFPQIPIGTSTFHDEDDHDHDHAADHDLGAFSWNASSLMDIDSDETAPAIGFLASATQTIPNSSATASSNPPHVKSLSELGFNLNDFDPSDTTVASTEAETLLSAHWHQPNANAESPRILPERHSKRALILPSTSSRGSSNTSATLLPFGVMPTPTQNNYDNTELTAATRALKNMKALRNITASASSSSTDVSDEIMMEFLQSNKFNPESSAAVSSNVNDDETPQAQTQLLTNRFAEMLTLKPQEIADCINEFSGQELAHIDFKLLSKLMQRAAFSNKKISELKAMRKMWKNRESANKTLSKRRTELTVATGMNQRLGEMVHFLNAETQQLKHDHSTLQASHTTTQTDLEECSSERDQLILQVQQLQAQLHNRDSNQE